MAADPSALGASPPAVPAWWPLPRPRYPRGEPDTPPVPRVVNQTLCPLAALAAGVLPMDRQWRGGRPGFTVRSVVPWMVSDAIACRSAHRSDCLPGCHITGPRCQPLPGRRSLARPTKPRSAAPLEGFSSTDAFISRHRPNIASAAVLSGGSGGSGWGWGPGGSERRGGVGGLWRGFGGSGGVGVCAPGVGVGGAARLGKGRLCAG
jgi:hypothetical protein